MTELKSILRGAATLTALELISLFLAFVTLPYLMRVLGPTEFGRYAFGVAACGALTAFVDYGFNQLGPKEVARSPADGPARAAIFWPVQWAKLQLLALGLPLVAGLAWSLGLHQTYGSVLLAASAGALASLMFPQWFLQGAQHYRTMATSLALARAAVAIATWLLVSSQQHAAWAVLLQALTGCWAGLIAIWHRPYARSIRFVRPRRGESWRYLRLGFPLFLSTAAVSLYTTCVPLLVGIATTPTTVGLFSLGDKVRAAVQTLLAPIGVAAFPKFSVWLREDRARGLVAARQVMALQVGLGAVAAAGIFVFAEPVIRWLVGAQFLPAVPAAQLLGLCIVFTAVSNTLGVQVMLPLNMDRAYSMILSLCALIGIAAVWLLCRLWQATGTALALVLTEALVAVLMAAYLKRRRVL